METNTTQAISFPEPTGAYAVGTTSFYFADSEREELFTEDPNDYREITAKVWYPSVAVPGATTVPYMSEELSSAFASGVGIPLQDFVNLIQSIPTHSVENAPVAAAESKYPVLFLSHGGGDMPEFNTVRAEELASQGYVVVAINHTYESALNILPDGRVVSHSPLPDAAQNVAARAGDIQFVLDELEKFTAGNDPTGLFNGKLDLDRVGVFGVSTGGATATEVLSIDPRFKAGANLDGTLRGDTVDASVSQPYMLFNNVAFGTEISSDALYRGDDQTFLNHLQNEGYEVTILGSTHLHYTSDVPFLFPLLRDSGIELGGLTGSFNYFFDPQATIETYEHKNFELIDPNRVTQITNDYITAFFNQHLNNQESPLFADSSFPLPEAYPEVIAQFTRETIFCLTKTEMMCFMVGEKMTYCMEAEVTMS
jgi:dienelactone hydrolase